MSQRKKPSVVVTGTSTGIGLETTKVLAKKGWTVFAGVRKEADAARLREVDSNIYPIIIDVTKQDQINAAFEEVSKQVGFDGLDALVNNAGLAMTGPIEFMPIEDIQRQFDINVFGVIRVTQAAMPLLRMGTPGRIVIISSIAGQMNMPYGGVYCASKGAMDCISESLRREVSKWGIKVACVKPGGVKTNFNETSLNLANEIKTKFPPGSKCYEYYGKDLENFPNVAAAFEKSSSAPVSKVGNVIVSALTSRNPKNFYYDTWGTWAAIGMINRTPTGFIDKQFNTMFTATK